MVQIRDLRPSQKDIDIPRFIILQKEGMKEVKGDTLHTFIVADESGCASMCVWSDYGPHLRPGDICELKRGYTGIWNGCLMLYGGKGAKLIRHGDFTMLFSETPNMSGTPIA